VAVIKVGGYGGGAEVVGEQRAHWRHSAGVQPPSGCVLTEAQVSGLITVHSPYTGPYTESHHADVFFHACCDSCHPPRLVLPQRLSWRTASCAHSTSQHPTAHIHMLAVCVAHAATEADRRTASCAHPKP
jgi:hypothetical protein